MTIGNSFKNLDFEWEVICISLNLKASLFPLLSNRVVMHQIGLLP